jgi:hypothetical protein
MDSSAASAPSKLSKTHTLGCAHSPVTCTAPANLHNAPSKPSTNLSLGCAHSPKTTDTMLIRKENGVDSLHPPLLATSNEPVLGSDKEALCKQNKARQIKAQLVQTDNTTGWSELKGTFFLPDNLPTPGKHRNRMCPARLARLHPAGGMLDEWAKFGCPTMTGKPWTVAQMQSANDRGPHKSARTPDDIQHFAEE